jgi:hypothetical protein
MALLGAAPGVSGPQVQPRAALDTLRDVSGRLPPSGTLVACMGVGLRRLGADNAADAFLVRATQIFPDDPVIRHLAAP